MIAIPVAAFMGSVAMIVGRTPQLRCNDLGHGLPFIAIRRADDCGSLHLSFKHQAASCWLCCGYVGNAFALSKRSGISTALAAASILSIPLRHTAIGVWLFIAW